ncbi:MAG: NADPH-dependent glutamate synthase [Caldiserica bacterium]|nr:NADPH-dependent glutamate synthase [Caldisericota bacterium]
MNAATRLKLPPVVMPEQDPVDRVHNVREVPLGFTPAMALQEAQRCLHCPDQPCVKGCPVGVQIPDFIKAIEEGDFAGGIGIIKQTNLLPAVCGRVCPQEEQCQMTCTVGKAHRDVGQAVQIGKLERFLADWERENHAAVIPQIPPSTGKRVAVIGSGPAGLTVAGDLIKLGHAVTVFEALHKPGGVLGYGIPEFRLPKEIVYKEVSYLTELGVDFQYNTVIGRSLTVDEVRQDYDAIFVGSGAGLPNFLGIPGESLLGVYSANEYLTRANLMHAYDENSNTPILHGKSVAVLGGGNVAMDSARTAMRLGALKVMVIYRRSEEEMPARKEEYHHAVQEGIEVHFLQNPVEILGNPGGWVTGLTVQQMQLGEPDASGRRRPLPIPGQISNVPADVVVVAIGNSPNPLIPAALPGLGVNKHGGIVTDEETMETSIPGIFAGGDIVLGAATVILAMGQGRKAAGAIHAWLTRATEVARS